MYFMFLPSLQLINVVFSFYDAYVFYWCRRLENFLGTEEEGVSVGPTVEVVLEGAAIMEGDTAMSVGAVVAETRPVIIEVFIVWLDENMDFSSILLCKSIC